ncbi:type I methionyl aminopeptidase [Faecalibacter bovis]|uniref:Methionine aminopeptidase n=1 Tax=Faecalibacter bovis TaxID=2898187 RepID=A0ABX7XCG6_9FLAO|nr:type I methionyl aminopeptidase [Faecalibacter bovis]MBS7334522.1 type I methionyl aminopeptidase [Weeksellaceae bacterium]QTV05585.1 type I methionyl aminopeptidase [Faecalibacter bovis]
MIIETEEELIGMKAVSEAVAITLKEMKDYVKPGMSTLELDIYGSKILEKFGAKSAPYETYKFPGFTCLSVNEEICHGIPKADKIIMEGDVINIDVSAELNGFWADNGGSIVVGDDINGYQKIVDASISALQKAINAVKSGVKIADIGGIIEKEAKKHKFSVIENLTGHGVGRSLHEEPLDLLNFRDPDDKRRLRKNSVIALETFISENSYEAIEQADGWTMIGNEPGVFAQHEHTVLVTSEGPMILTHMNGNW